MSESQPGRESAQAQYACLVPRRGSRRYDQPEDGQRTAFQRDCDRIVHSNAFRLLLHKTQVFVAPLYGQYRTRLTHTIEVARVTRSLASFLGLNPDLAEAVALAHDLGHPPFGHIGEETLGRLMRDHGGFDHNDQAIRIVTMLERSYIRFDGLNPHLGNSGRHRKAQRAVRGSAAARPRRILCTARAGTGHLAIGGGAGGGFGR